MSSHELGVADTLCGWGKGTALSTFGQQTELRLLAAEQPEEAPTQPSDPSDRG